MSGTGMRGFVTVGEWDMQRRLRMYPGWRKWGAMEFEIPEGSMMRARDPRAVFDYVLRKARAHMDDVVRPRQ